MSYVTHPFDHLKKLERDAIRLSAELPQEEGGSMYWEGVGFKLDNHLFTVNIGDIVEIMPVPLITPLPGVKPWVKGVANVHGRLISVIDLGSFLGRNEVSKSSNNRIIVVDQKDMFIGLMVNEVYGKQHLSMSEYHESLSVDLPHNILSFTNGCYQQGDRHIVFDIHQLISSDHFLAVTSE